MKFCSDHCSDPAVGVAKEIGQLKGSKFLGGALLYCWMNPFQFRDSDTFWRENEKPVLQVPLE